MILKVSNAYARKTDADLIEFSRNVIGKMTDNPAFPTPMVALADLKTGTDAFDAAVIAAFAEDRLKIAEKNARRESLITLLAVEAAYVQGTSAGDLTILLSSGFEPVSTNRAQIELPAPVIENIENSASGQLTLRLTPVKTARSYEIRMMYGTNGWQTVCVFTQARNIVLGNLTPGIVAAVCDRRLFPSSVFKRETWDSKTRGSTGVNR